MTFSILAFDEASSAVGVGVASRALAVGARVPCLRPAVGGAVVQAFAPLAWGVLAVDRLSQGASPTDVIGELQAAAHAASAQVAVVDASGRAAGFTGSACEPEAGTAVGAACCTAANLMERPGVPEEVLTAFENNAHQPFAERLLLALAAGEALGGDIRGRQSAALRIVGPTRGDQANVDLRVDDSRAPLAELRRLLTLHRADAWVASSADGDGHYRDVDTLRAAVALAPDDLGAVSGLGLALLRAGQADEALPHLAHLTELEPRTPARLQRLIDTGHLSASVAPVLRRLNRE